MASLWSNRWLPKVAAGVYAVLLALVSLLPSNQLPTIPDWSRLFSPDKVAHFGAYALFALLLSVCSPERGKLSNIIIAIFLAAAYGALIEVLQGIAGTGRQSDPVDAVANTLGALLGGLLWFLLYRLKKYLWRRPEMPE